MKFDYTSDLDNLSLKKGSSKILVVAGNINLEKKDYQETLIKLKKSYNILIYVDGVEDHKKNKIIDYKDFENPILKEKNIYYLPLKDLVIKDHVFIGFCGWWNLEKGEKVKDINISKKASEEADKLYNKLSKYSKNDNIKSITIVTNTVALPRFTEKNNYAYNSYFLKFNKYRFPKIKEWIFGNSNKVYNLKGCGITYLSSPGIIKTCL